MAGPEIPMPAALHAEQAKAALEPKLRLYGRFVGSWRLEIDHHPPGGGDRRAEGEWHFGWVLDGKAIQDVWIFPARRLRGSGKPDEPWYRYGSTFRWYDPAIDGWHITYFEPGARAEVRQIGRAVGADIVQVGDDPSGIMRRWRFVDITELSFRWIGELSWDKGGSWTREMEMWAERVG
jgi:hypothetical protein